MSIVDSKKLTTQSGLKIEAEYLYQDIDLNDYDFLVIPGGKATFENNLSSSIVKINLSMAVRWAIDSCLPWLS